MKTVKVQNGDRLDEIVYRYYGTLKVFTKVLEANPHLDKKVLLESSDKVYLPTFNIEDINIKEVKSLW